MNTLNPLAADLRASAQPRIEAYPAQGITGSAAMPTVSWPAIFAGAAAASALSLILLVLGTGLGLSSISPWANQGASAKVIGVSTILWLTLTQMAAAGLGGYLAGRLRTKWTALHTDETYFRDTAHGFLAWAVATLLTAALLTSAISSIVGGGVQAGASMAAGVGAAGVTAASAMAGKNDSPSAGDGLSSVMGYSIDSLFRKAASTSATATAAATASTTASATATGGEAGSVSSSAEMTRIFANNIRSGTLSAADTSYVAQAIVQRTGITQADAEKRVSDTFVKLQTTIKDAEIATRDAADKARKASSYAALWLFVALLAGAFLASLCATYGGRRRDL